MTNEQLIEELESKVDRLEAEADELRDELRSEQATVAKLEKAIRWMVDNAENIIRDGRDAL